MTYVSGDVWLGEELAQETLVRAYDKWDTLAAHAAVEAWIYQIAMNLWRSRLRRMAVERRAAARLTAASVVHVPDPAELLAVRDAISSLPPKQRAAVVLRYYSDLSVEDTARVLQCAAGTVKALTHQAMCNLRSRLDFEEVE